MREKVDTLVIIGLGIVDGHGRRRRVRLTILLMVSNRNEQCTLGQIGSGDPVSVGGDGSP